MTRPSFLFGSMLLTSALALATLAEGEARACGGCFIPSENPTVVTDHRMILSISQQQSTLYDQIRYTGAPSSFAWVLPISGEVAVGLSSDVLFSALDTRTQTRILQPARNCAARPSSCPSFQDGGVASASGESDGVNVLKREVVGPYETVQLQASTPNALTEWLAKNGFNVPPDVKPIVDTYQQEHFNFLALKLVPGKDVQDMRPVRVTTQGANVALPLRMVAAGTGAQVGISLWVVAEGRYEPQNFDAFVIKNDDLAWDWAQNKSNYIDLRAEKTAAGKGRTWEVESSIVLYRQDVESVVNQPRLGDGGYPETEEEAAAQSYLPVTGNEPKTARQVRTEDLDTLFAGIATGSSRVTRLRADLAHAALDADLVMRAAADQSVLSNVRQVTRESNEPLCPVYSSCDQVGTAPRSQAAAMSSDDDGGCSAGGRGRSGSPAWMWASLGFVGLAVGRTIRRRRSGR